MMAGGMVAALPSSLDVAGRRRHLCVKLDPGTFNHWLTFRMHLLPNFSYQILILPDMRVPKRVARHTNSSRDEHIDRN